MFGLDTKTAQKIASKYQKRLNFLTSFIRSPQPLYLLFMITKNCNLNCGFCNQSKMKGKISPDEMSLSDVRKIESNLDFLFQPRIHLFGGEPTVNSDFEKMIRFFTDKGYTISLTTNGKDSSWVKRNTLNKINEITVSINEKGYDYVIDTLEKIRKQGSSTRTVVNCPITPEHQSEFVDIIKSLEDKDVDSLVFQHLIFNSTEQKMVKEIDLNLLRSQMKKADNSDIHVIFYPHISSLFDYYRNPDYPSGGKCLVPWLEMEILPSGNVTPCKWLVADKELIAGNAKRESLKKIWNNKSYRDFRKRIYEKGVFEDDYCFRCCYRSY